MNNSTMTSGFCPDFQLPNEGIENDRNCNEDVVSEINTVHRIQKFEQHDYKMTIDCINENLEDYQQWEISTQLQLRKLEESLNDALMTIETQRSSLVDLQLQNEILSQKLNEEKISQESIVQKVEEIWDFYNMVEQDTTKLNTRIKTCEDSREDMKQFHKLKCQEIEALIAKFMDLQIKHESACEKYKRKLENEEKERCQLASEYQENTQLLENKIKDSEIQLLEKDENIQNMVSELKSLQDKNAIIDDEKECFKNTVDTYKNIIDNKEEQLQEKSSKVNELETLIKEKDEQLQKNTDDINSLTVVKQSLDFKIEELEKSLTKTIEDSRVQLEKTNINLNEEMSRIQILMEKQQKLENENDDLKLQKDSLVMEIATINKNLRETQDSNDIANKMCEVMKSQLQGAEAKIQELGDSCIHMDQLKEEVKLKEEIISRANNKEEEQKQEFETLVQLQETLQLEVEALKSKATDDNERFNNFKNEYESLQRNYDAEKLAKQTLCEELRDVQKSKETLQLELTNCQSQLVSQETELQKLRMKHVQEDAQLNSMREHVKFCEAEIQNWKTKSEETEKTTLSTLQAKLSRIEKLESKLRVAVVIQKRAKAMKCEIIEKTGYINELEMQVKTLNMKQSELSIEKLHSCDKVNSLMEEIQNLNSKMKNLSNDTNDKVCHWETVLNERNKRIFEMESEAKTHKESFEELQQEYQQLVKKCETDKAEFFSTLSCYKMSNQRIVSDKEKEIASFRIQLEKEKESHEVEMRKMQRDLSTLQESLQNSEFLVESEKSRKEEIEKINLDLQRQIIALKNELNEKKSATAEVGRNDTAAAVVANPGGTPTNAATKKTFSVTTPKSYEEIAGALSKQMPSYIENRKHVTFSKLPSSSESETSASDCMEISSIIPAQKIKGKVVSPCTISFRPATPVSQPNRLSLNKTSPNVKQPAFLSEPKPIPRGKPVEFTPNAKKLKMDSKMPATPRKGMPKFFKITQGERNTFWSEKKKKSEENLKWFDIDGAFAFNCEN